MTKTTTTTKKVTKRERFTEIRSIVEGLNRQDLVDFCNHELELLANKNVNGKNKPTTQQIANDETKVKILEVLKASNVPMRITEILKADSYFTEKDITNQRVSALMRQLIDDDLIIRIEEKRVAKFAIA